MKTANSPSSFDQLRTLYDLREKKLLDNMAAYRVELEEFSIKLAEQQDLIQSLRDELDALHAMRSKQNIDALTSHSLRAESDRRRLLTADLEKEEFYLPGFESDVKKAQGKLKLAERKWQRMRERTEALKQTMERQRQKDRQRQARREEAEQDDRQKTGVSYYG